MIATSCEGGFHRPILSLTAVSEGVRSLPELVRFNAIHNPDHPFCIQAEIDRGDTTNASHGVQQYKMTTITMMQLQRAVWDCAAWLQREIGAGKKMADPLTLFMESDVGLFIYLAAALQARIPVLLLSPRLSASSVKHLMEGAHSATVLVSKRFQALLTGGLPAGATMVVPAPYTAFIGTSKSDPASPDHCGPPPSSLANGKETARYPLTLHSSGTTGLPKLIPVGEQYPIVYAACHEFPADATIDWTNLSTLPLYHGFGLLAPCLSLSVGLTCCFPPASTIPAAESTASLLGAFSAGSLMTVPSILEDMLAFPDQRALEALRPLRFVAIGGGALSPRSAETLVHHDVQLLNHYGATELGALAPIYCPGPDNDCRFVRLRDDLGLELQPTVSEAGSEQPARYKLVGVPVGSDQPFEIQDELELNPNSSRTEVRLLGRRDDIIVLKTGEKVRARLLEESLSSDPNIQCAVCLGQGRFEVILLIEGSPEARLEPQELVNHIWELVQTINPSLDRHARISSRSAIILKPPTKAIPRSDKGSVMRREAHEAFKDEIEAAYAELDNEAGQAVNMHPGNVDQIVRDMVLSVLGDTIRSEILQNDDDFYEIGMDSLQTVRLARLLSAALRSSIAAANSPKPADIPKLSAEVIYRHPSVKSLCGLICDLLGESKEAKSQPDSLDEVWSLLSKFGISDTLPGRQPPQGHRTVLLTGSTGNLGAHILGVLVRDRTVRQVVCLNRPARLAHVNGSASSNPQDALRYRQEQALRSAGVQLQPGDWDKVSFLASGRGERYLDDSVELVRHLASSVTHIFHLAWPMDFNRQLHSFIPHIEALRSLLRFARTAGEGGRVNNRKVRLIFTSSIAVVRHHRQLTGQTTVPEAPVMDPRIATDMGYARAKWICEKILQHDGMAYPHALEAVNVRVGQLSGPESSEGVWKSEEHIPALLRASQQLGAFPKLEGSISWIPVDRAARSVVEIAFSPRPIPPDQANFHVENPVRQSVQDLFTLAKPELGIVNDPVDFDEWVDRAVRAGNLGSLEGFFRDDFRALGTGEVILNTARALGLSRTLKNTSAVGRDLLIEYLHRWRRDAFLHPAGRK